MKSYSISNFMGNTDLDTHLQGQFLVEIDNSEEYPRVSILLKKDGALTELVRVEHLTEQDQTRALVYADTQADDQDPIIIGFE